MKNLLPERKQKEHRHRYYGRLGVTALVLVVVVELIALAALVPAFVTVQAQKFSTTAALDDVNARIEAGGGTEARTILTTTSALVKVAAATHEYPALSDVVDLIRPHEFRGIAVSEVSISVQSPTNVQANVSGRAETRTALVDYSSALENDPNIETVTLPLRDLAASQNIPFTLTLTFSLDE
jgi:hypothetical protein